MSSANKSNHNQVVPYNGERKQVTEGSVKHGVLKSLDGFDELQTEVKVMVVVSTIFDYGPTQVQSAIADVLRKGKYDLFGDQVEKLAFLSMLFPSMVHYLHKSSSVASGFALKAKVLINSIKSKKSELDVETLKQYLPGFDSLTTLLCAAHERFISIFLGEGVLGLQTKAIAIAKYYMSGNKIACDCPRSDESFPAVEDCIYCSARTVANIMTDGLTDEEDEIICESLVKTITTAKAIAEPDVSILKIGGVRPSNMVLMTLSGAGVPIWKLDLAKVISHGKTMSNKVSSTPIKYEKAVNASNLAVEKGMQEFLSRLKK